MAKNKIAAPKGQPKTLKLADLSDTQIKSLLYDQMVALENTKRVIGVLEGELKRRQAPLPKPPVKEEDKKEVQKEKNDKKVENIKDFYSFKMRLFEQADEEEEGEVEEDSGDMDFVEEAWYEFFEEGEEEAWIVSEDGRKLQKLHGQKFSMLLKIQNYQKIQN